MRRRVNGTGTIRTDHRNVNFPYLAYAPSVVIEGQRYSHYIGSYHTKKEAEKAIMQYSVTSHTKYEDYTTKQLWEYYINTKQYTNLSPSGQKYNRASYAHIAPLYERKFATLRPKDFQNCLDLAESKGLSTSTLKGIRSVCTILSNLAVLLDIIPHSYSTKLYVAKTEKKEKQVFTQEEIDLLMSSDDKWAKSICVLIYSGMRIEEMLQMKRSDIYDGCFHGGEKTDAGRNRIIPIHSKIQDKVEDICGKEWFIETERGTRFRQDTYRKEKYYKILQKLGLPKLNPHCCRHTFFSLMDEHCGDKLAMTLIGGHTDPRFTEMTYVHPDIERLKKAIENI